MDEWSGNRTGRGRGTKSNPDTMNEAAKGSSYQNVVTSVEDAPLTNESFPFFFF